MFIIIIVNYFEIDGLITSDYEYIYWIYAYTENNFYGFN